MIICKIQVATRPQSYTEVYPFFSERKYLQQLSIKKIPSIGLNKSYKNIMTVDLGRRLPKINPSLSIG